MNPIAPSQTPLEKFLYFYDLMRAHQKAYFKNKMLDDLQKSKRYEGLADLARKELKVTTPQATQEALL